MKKTEKIKEIETNIETEKIKEIKIKKERQKIKEIGTKIETEKTSHPRIARGQRYPKPCLE